jgi:hypothetical protein
MIQVRLCLATQFTEFKLVTTILDCSSYRHRQTQERYHLSQIEGKNGNIILR